MTAPLAPGAQPEATRTGYPAGGGIGPATGPTPTDQSIGGLIAEVAEDVSRLFRQEVELAKAEMKAEASKAGKAAGMLGGAGAAGHMVALFASLAAMFGLAAVMPIGWSALIIAVLWAGTAAVLYSTGRKRLKDVSPMPQQTVETLKEDAEWLRNQTR